MLNNVISHTKKIDFKKLYEKFDKIKAGIQSIDGCGISSMQNVQNYYRSLLNQDPIQNLVEDYSDDFNEVEQEFLKNGGSQNLLRRPILPTDILEHLQIMNLSPLGISISIPNRSDNNKVNIASKISQFLLLKHFSSSESPVITQIVDEGVQHYITICGVGKDSDGQIKALVLNSKPNHLKPDIIELSNLCYKMATCYNPAVKNSTKCTSTMIFTSKKSSPNTDYRWFDSSFSSDNYYNWYTFKKIAVDSATGSFTA